MTASQEFRGGESLHDDYSSTALRTMPVAGLSPDRVACAADDSPDSLPKVFGVQPITFHFWLAPSARCCR